MKKTKRNIAKKKSKLSRVKSTGSVTAAKNLDLLFGNAMSFHQAGRFAEAEALYRQILQSNPSSVPTLCNLALAVWKQGRLDETETLFRNALKIAPGDSPIHNFLGNLFFEQDRLSEAESAYAKAIKIDPGNAGACYNLGLLLRRQGKLKDSGKAFQAAINAKPDYFEALNNLGSIKLEQGHPHDAAKLYEKAIAIQPDYIEAISNLGICYRELGLYRESEIMYRRAIDLQPTNTETLNNLGILLADQGKYTDAEKCYRKALKTQPKHINVLTNLGEILEKTNRLEEARTIILKALEINPAAQAANRLMSVLLRREGDYKEALNRLSAIDLQNCSLENRTAVHHELGMTHERLDQSEEAFHHFAEAKKIQKLTPEGQRADKRRYLAFLDRISTFFSQELVDQWKPENSGKEQEQPVFIVGFPRSGTTLLDQLLNSHSAFCVAEETDALAGVIKKIAARTKGYPEALDDITHTEIQDLRHGYWADIKSHLGPRENWEGKQIVDKFPLHIVHLGLIYKLFPHAGIIVAIRHPNDVCLSNFMQLFKLNDAMANFTTLEDAATCYSKVMGLWMHYKAIVPLQFHRIRYEDLINDFTQEVNNLLNFLNVEWDERITKFYEHAQERKKIYTPSYQQVSQPIYKRSVYRWQKYASQFESVKDILSPFIKEFGYDEQKTAG